MSRSQVDWQAALALHSKGWTYARIAKECGCARLTVARHLRALGASPRHPRRSPEERLLLGLWDSMVKRCSDPKYPTFRHYGGRGINVARVWRRFASFEEWARRTGYQPGQALLRTDKDRGFSPANCYWGARQRDSAAVRLRAFGVEKTIAQWALDPRCTVSEDSLRYRLQRGVEPELAISNPRKTGHPALPRTGKPVIAKRVSAKTDWKQVLRLRARGMPAAKIAAKLGVPYSTVQVGLHKRFGALRPRVSPEQRRLYRLWTSLKARTTNPRHHLYPVNGAIGVRLCREWQDFHAFLAWAKRTGAKPRLCLARVRRTGPFSPANCKWLSVREWSAKSMRDAWERRRADRAEGGRQVVTMPRNPAVGPGAPT